MPSRSLTIAAIRQPAFLYDADGTIAEANEPAEALAGRSLAGSTAAAVVGIFDIRSSDGTPLMASDLPAIRVVAGTEAVDVPLTVRASDGRTVHILATASPLRNGAEVVGALTIWQDVSALEAARAGAETATTELEVQQEELRQQGDELIRVIASLDRQRGLLDAILGTLPHRVSVWDRDHRLVWANERFAAERCESREALAGRPWSELGYDPAVIGPLAEETVRAISDGRRFSCEVQVAGPNGAPWLAVTVVPIFGDSFLVISDDATERKEAEDALRKSLETVRALISAPTDLAVLLDVDGTILEINDRYADVLGRPARGLIGACIWEVATPGEADYRRAHVDRAVETKRIVRFEEHRDGRWYDTIVSPILSDGDRVARVAIIARDITARKQAEEALRHSLDQLSVAQAAARSGLWDWDATTNELTWSRELFDLLDLAPTEGMTFAAWLALIHPEDREAAMAAVDRSFDERVPVEIEYRVILPSGQVRWMNTLGDTTYDAEGQPLRMAGICVDITERRRAEDALRESEERLRLARACAGIGMWEWHRPAPGDAGATEHVELHDASTEVLQFDDWRSIVNPDDLEWVEEERDAALARHEPFELEFRYDDGSGTTRWMRVIGGGTYDAAGRLVRILGVNMDITAQKQAEAALQESERRHAFLLALGDRLRELTDVRGIAAVASELIGRHLGVNGVVYCEVDEAGERATVRADWTDGTVPGAAGRFRMDDFGIGGLYRQGLVKRTEDVTTDCGEDEATAHCALGIRASLGVPICRGGRLAAVLAVHSARPRAWTDAEVELVREIGDRVWDAVERARAEEAVRKRERTLQGIFRAAPVGIGMVSHRRITQANDQLCRMTGYTRDELIGQDSRLLYPSDEAYEYVGREKYTQIMADGIGAVETQWRTKDGTVLDILLSSSPVDLSRPHEDVVFNALNITRLRESERALESYMDDLQRSNEELQRFAYVASHDLQEPLRSIISFSQLLERRYRGKLDTDADEFIEFIVEGGNRMQRLIMDLLQLSRVETKAKPLSPTDAGEVVADALRLMETPIREAGATVEVDPLPVVMADAAQLAQVFTNLVGNALKYRRPEVPLEVRISAERVGAFWRFAVTDNGIGIEAEYFDRIFVIFQRLHTREEYAGTGIGLAVVRKIVERHGGRIGVESTPGEGSTFSFTLPAA